MPAAAWRPSGVLTLLTDFGASDAYVGIVKGVLLSRCASLRAAVDLTHEVAPQDVRSASFHLAHAWRWFPRGTVHLAVVDPGVGSARRILVASEAGHAFLAPDNGLLGPVLSDDADVRALDVERFALAERSRTFHGRDVFAPAAAVLACGLDPREAGAACADWQRARFPAPAPRAAGGWSGEVLCADRFGNLVTNLPPALLSGGSRGWELRAAGATAPVREAYSDAAQGDLLALVDSYGLLELCVRDGDAAARLGLSAGSAVELARHGAR